MPTFIPYFINGNPNTSRMESYIPEEDRNITDPAIKQLVEELAERIDETN